jgi:hypothetical protein
VRGVWQVIGAWVGLAACVFAALTSFALLGDIAMIHIGVERRVRVSMFGSVRSRAASVAAIAALICAVPLTGVSDAGAATANCRSFSSGRTTCTYGSGGYSNYYSYNPRSGYRSNGYRYSTPGSSWGSRSYSTPRSSGNRSYTSSRPYSGYRSYSSFGSSGGYRSYSGFGSSGGYRSSFGRR